MKEPSWKFTINDLRPKTKRVVRKDFELVKPIKIKKPRAAAANPQRKEHSQRKKQRDIDIVDHFYMARFDTKEAQLTDVETAKLKAQTIKEQGQLKYNLKLLQELEADKSRKLMVVNILAVLSLAAVGVTYLLYEHALNNNILNNLLAELLV